MRNFQSWNDDYYIIHSRKAIARQFDIPEGNLAGYQSFLITPNRFRLDRLNYEAGKARIYPLAETEELEIRGRLNHPILSETHRDRGSIDLRGLVLGFGEKRVMAIVNLTPDSFYPPSRLDESRLDEYFDLIRRSAVDIVDLGGESTRPGSDPVDPDEEWRRLKHPLEMALNKGLKVSIDTYRSEVARQALETGAHMINDVTGLEDDEIGILCKRYGAPLVIMHKKGDFKTMQDNPEYENVILEILHFFYERILKARRIGIEDNIILDPGIGFGKRVEDNLDIIKNLQEFKIGYPLMIGLSRKGFIGRIMNENVDEREISTLIFNTLAFVSGADIVRVHDIETSMKLKRIINELNKV